MEPQHEQRRLTTILAADVVGYSRLMGADEAGTLAALKAHRRELLEPKTAQYNGRTVKLMGDGALLEFASVVDGLRFAVEVQAAMPERNADVPEDRTIQYRIGLNIGDIIVDGDDIYGDGVNIAARLEGLAEPGGICIARNVFNQVRGKLDLTFEPLGEQRVKNIAEPIEVYRVTIDEAARALRTPLRPPATGRTWRWAAAAAILVLAVGAGSGYWTWDNWWRFQMVEAASPDRMAYPLPDRPSIAVMPFDNLTGDPADEYLPDGLSEEITAALSKLSSLFVISRTTTKTYRGSSATVQQVAEELGVRFVLEGGVQRDGSRIRVTAQLVDALSGRAVWADRYDRELDDLFAVKDDITLNITSSIGAELDKGERDRRLSGETDSLEAWLVYKEGYEHHMRFSREENALARQHFQRALAIDPEFLSAYSVLGNTYRFDARFGWAESQDEAYGRALEIFTEVLERNPDHAPTFARLAFLHRDIDQIDAALEYAAKAVALDPNDYLNRGAYGTVLMFAGRPEEAIAELETAMRISPVYPDWVRSYLGESYLQAGDLERARLSFESHLARPPSSPLNEADARRYLAIVYDAMGREQDAREQIGRLLEVFPRASIAYFRSIRRYRDASTEDGWAETWRRLGMPD